MLASGWFLRLLKKTLKARKMELGRLLSPDIYEIKSGMVSFEIDISEARRAFEQTSSACLIDELIDKLEIDFATKYKLISFQNARAGIRLLLMRDEDLTPNYIYSEFSGRLKTVVAFSNDRCDIEPLDVSYIKKWGIPRDVLFAVADKNMCDILGKAALLISEAAGKIRVMEFHDLNEQLRASFMACSEFKNIVGKKLGSKFLVIIPTRGVIIAVENVTNNILELFGPIVLEEYQKSKNKLSTDVFLFAGTAMSVAGKFNEEI